MKVALILYVLIILAAGSLCASDFQIQKQKLRLSLEYENFVDFEGNEVATSGWKTSYLLKGQGTLGKHAIVHLELQTAGKVNFSRQFASGELSPLVWSNRVNASVIVPVQKFFVGGSLYFRNKWLADIPEEDQFIDIFGGEGFREIIGGVHLGYTISPLWEVSAAFEKSDLNFDEFPLSNSNWNGVSFRLTKKIQEVKLHFDYRIRSVDFNRPISINPPPVLIPAQVESRFPLQHDRFWEAGVSLELLRTIYLSGGYYYQNNDSNNPGFSYQNHRIQLLLGTELPHQFHFQAYGILQRQDYPVQDEFPQFPVLLEENDNNTMAASLTKTLSERRELEFGVQWLTNYSSFLQLNASKYIFYTAFNYRF